MMRPVGDAEGALHRLGVDRPRLVEGRLVLQVHVDRSAGPELVAVGTVDVQIRPGPLVQASPSSCGFTTVFARSVVASGDLAPRDQTRSMQARSGSGSPPDRSGRELALGERRGLRRPTGCGTDRHSARLGKCQVCFRTPPGACASLTVQFDVLPDAGHQVGVRSVRRSSGRCSRASPAVEMEDLRLQPAAAGRVALLHLQRERPGQHAVLAGRRCAA